MSNLSDHGTVNFICIEVILTTELPKTHSIIGITDSYSIF